MDGEISGDRNQNGIIILANAIEVRLNRAVENFQEYRFSPEMIELFFVDLVQSHLRGFTECFRIVGSCSLSCNLNFARVRGSPGSLVKKGLHVDLSPATQLTDAVPDRNVLFEASPSCANSEPAENILKSALAGGLACAFSAALMHPVDTLKTHVQTSTLSFTELMSKVPQIGLNGLYKGSIPAVVGQFSGHGLRMGFFEGSKLILTKFVPALSIIQVQSLASFCSTFLETASRIPAEVLKQRLQAGLFNNVGEACVGMLHQDGIKGFFRGTKATLLREVPFYVAGTAVYDEAKEVVGKLLGRDLEPWETILVGALSGGLTAVATTPLDVVKTKMMTAPESVSISMSMVAWTVLREEGLAGLYRGALPRFFWVAPLGAINFAGYELIRRTLDRV